MKPGENILTLVRATQRLHTEIAALLKTFEKLAGERGYVNRKDKSVSNGCSSSIDTPEEWMTPWMFRHLQKKNNIDDVVIFNVVLAPSTDVPPNRDFSEPLVMCARFRYVKGKAKDHADDWDPWTLWFFGPDKELNRVYSRNDLNLGAKDFQEESGWDDAKYKAMQEVKFLAIPLAAMSDSKVLENDVIKRVLG